MAKADKKIFVTPAGKEFTLVMGTRWYLEYYTDRAGVSIRHRAYGGANRIKDHTDRERAFYRLALQISQGSSRVDLLDTALADRKALQRLKTWQSQKARLKYFKLWLGDRSPAIDAKAAKAFISHLVENGKSSATISSYKMTLSALYKAAGLPNVWPAVPVPSVVSQSLMYFTPKRAERIIRYLKDQEPALALACMFCYYCFIRPGELRLMTADCINIEQGTITIPAAISKNKKTGTVIIPDDFMGDLQAAQESGILGEGLLFFKYRNVGTFKNKKWLPSPVGKNYFNRRHAAAMAALKINGRYAFYSWKHTGAVRAVKAGINLKDLQLQLRHHSLDMVNEYLKNLGVMDSADLRTKFPGL